MIMKDDTLQQGLFHHLSVNARYEWLYFRHLKWTGRASDVSCMQSGSNFAGVDENLVSKLVAYWRATVLS